MAKLPYTINWTKTLNGDGSVTVSWTVSDATPAQVASGGNKFPAGTALCDIVDTIKRSVRDAMNANLGFTDLGASGSFTLNLIDVGRQ